jgi:alpha-1,3-fucosyltransferase 10
MISARANEADMIRPSRHDSSDPPRRPVILIYNSMFGRLPDLDDLARRGGCTVTTDRRRIAEADAVVIHLPTVRDIWAVPKFPGQLWVAWCMESRVTCPALASEAIMAAFDIRMTYERDADIWCSYVPEGFESALALPVARKTARAPVVLFQSASYDRWGRNAYLRRLMQLIPVHSYGRFMRNRWQLRRRPGGIAKRRVIRRYRFCLAFENSLAEDYVTEKLFDPLMVGTVPVYYGAPNVDAFAPHPDAFVNARDFDGPEALAAHLLRLAGDSSAFAELLRWREEGMSARFGRMLDVSRREAFCRLVDLVRQRSGVPPRLSDPSPAFPLGWLDPHQRQTLLQQSTILG